jgi:predicted DNA-binding antitoxin AbrB/MazE fold protein
MSAIRVKYEDGVFRPLHRVRSVKEGAIGEVRLKQEEERPTRRVSVRSSEFFGLWKGRKELGNGLSYTRKLRSVRRY